MSEGGREGEREEGEREGEGGEGRVIPMPAARARETAGGPGPAGPLGRPAGQPHGVHRLSGRRPASAGGRPVPNPVGRRFRLPAGPAWRTCTAHNLTSGLLRDGPEQPPSRLTSADGRSCLEALPPQRKARASGRLRSGPAAARRSGRAERPGGGPAQRSAQSSGPSESDSASASHVRCYACRGVPDAAGGCRRQGDAAAVGGGRVAAAADGDGDRGGFVSQLASTEKKTRQPRSF